MVRLMRNLKSLRSLRKLTRGKQCGERTWGVKKSEVFPAITKMCKQRKLKPFIIARKSFPFL